MIRTPIADAYLGRRNSIHRSRLRQIEKNRFPKKCKCIACREFFLCGNIEDYLRRQYYLGPDRDGTIRHVCWRCDLTNKVKVAAGTPPDGRLLLASSGYDQQSPVHLNTRKG